MEDRHPYSAAGDECGEEIPDDKIRVRVRERDHGKKLKVIVKHENFKLSLKLRRFNKDND
ncbi:MAG: hypothetical protein M1602_04020 [Firmicutes bacterium]|nr:hypothetical protein [Bacillota bacterium]